jgi:hypothetical protein
MLYSVVAQVVLPATFGIFLTGLLTQGLKSIAELAGISIGGWGAWVVSAVVAGLVAFGNGILAGLSPDLSGIIVGLLNYLLILVGANGLHSGAKLLGGA